MDKFIGFDIDHMHPVACVVQAGQPDRCSIVRLHSRTSTRGMCTRGSSFIESSTACFRASIRSFFFVPFGRSRSASSDYSPPNGPRHSGHRRKTPDRIDERETHRLKRCPCCGGPLQRCQHKRTRTIEDIPEEIELVVTEHTIHRDYCPNGQKHVEPVVPDAMPKVLEGWYEQIGEQARSSAHLHARRSGSRTARRHNPGRLCAIRSGIAASPLKCGPNLPTTSIADRGDCISFLL